MLYVWDEEERVARVSTAATRVKGRFLRRNSHAALHVSGPHFWSYAVAQGEAESSEVASTPGDDACRELLRLRWAFYEGIEDEQAFYRQMIEAKRLVVRLRVERVYGVMLERPPGA